MSTTLSLKTLSTAAAIAAALSFGAVAQAQTSSSTPPMQKGNDDSALPAPPSGTTGKSTMHSTNKAMKSDKSMSNKGTAAGASKLEDNSKPVTKGEGNK
ncbi:MAG: hypothetical protein JWP29_2773 [Rhodoferax sp.]|nr:hypothetical protein [Rhodoferax sp.]